MAHVAVQRKANENSAIHATSKTSLDAYGFNSHTDETKAFDATRDASRLTFSCFQSHFAKGVIAKYFNLPVYFYVCVQQKPASTRTSQKANARRDADLIR